jgi:uncharacterized protein YegL
VVTLKEFASPIARPLPVILLLDVSKSMALNGKIEALNASVADMLKTLRDEQSHDFEVQVAIITFGKEHAQLHQPLQEVSRIMWQPLEADGRTPMGAAIKMATELIEDRQQVPSRAYAPTLVLVSDGQPTDGEEWKTALQKLFLSHRASKAARFALAIGDDADEEVLKAFVNDPSGKVFQAQEVREIRKFFRIVTMSVSQRTRSTNPNDTRIPDAFDIEMFSDF